MLACIPVAHPCFLVIFSPALGVSSSRTEGREQNDLGRLFLRGLRVRSNWKLMFIHLQGLQQEGALGFQGDKRTRGRKEEQGAGPVSAAHFTMTQDPNSKHQHGRELGYII